jgi:hypothetical protein
MAPSKRHRCGEIKPANNKASTLIGKITRLFVFINFSYALEANRRAQFKPAEDSLSEFSRLLFDGIACD